MKTVIEMAVEAGLTGIGFNNAKPLERFAALVREEIYKDDVMTDAYMAGFAAGRDTGFKDGVELATAEEREACAKVCESLPHDSRKEPYDCAAAIRARGNL